MCPSIFRGRDKPRIHFENGQSIFTEEWATCFVIWLSSPARKTPVWRHKARHIESIMWDRQRDTHRHWNPTILRIRIVFFFGLKTRNDWKVHVWGNLMAAYIRVMCLDQDLPFLFLFALENLSPVNWNCLLLYTSATQETLHERKGTKWWSLSVTQRIHVFRYTPISPHLISCIYI